MKNKYTLMKESVVTDNFGNRYPDLATFPINSFTPKTKAAEYQLTQSDCLRFFSLIQSFYTTFEFYDDITLWLNEILFISDTDTNFERVIKLYRKKDIDDWYLQNITS